MMINLKDGTWDDRERQVYYRDDPHTWYCKKCKKIFLSPRKIGKHTIQVHGFYLPRSRNKPEKQIIVEEVETKPKPPKQTKHRLFPSDMMSHNTIRHSPNRDYIAEAKQKIEEKKQLEIQTIKQLRAEGYLSEEDAQIGVLRIIWPAHLPSFLKDLKEKKEREARHNELMQKIAIQTILRNIKNQT